VGAALRTFVAAALMAACAMPAPCADVELVIRATELHVGDGRVLRDVAVAIDSGRIVAIGPVAAARLQGRLERDARFLLPGLVAAAVVPEEATDAPSVDARRLATDSLDPRLAEGWLAAGVTSLAVSPGRLRLVSGRGGLARVMDDGVEVALARGAACASLSPEALAPPLLFDPTIRVTADNPLPPAKPQRPFTAMAAVAELRKLLTTSGDFADVAARRVPLRIRADRAEDIGRAVELQRELGFDLVIEGGAEAWKLAGRLAAARALVVLELPDPAIATTMGSEFDIRADAAGILDAAGVQIALAPRRAERRPDPLLLAAAAVRAGLSPEKAIEAITGLAARAIGAAGFGLVEVGAFADLTAFDRNPLALHASPAFVVSRGTIAHERDLAASDKAPIALRAGRVLTGRGVIVNGHVLVSGERIVSVGPSAALPEDAVVHDYGDDAVLAPGFIDAFGWLGQEPGSASGNGARTRAADALEPAHPSMERALRAGVTAALVAPGSRGPLLGSACTTGTRPKDGVKEDGEIDPIEAGRADILSADAGFVFSVDEGPSDAGPRAPRIKALKDLVQKAKAYHDKRAKADKKDKPAEGGDKKDAKTPEPKKPAKKDKDETKDEPDPALEPLRPLFGANARCWLRAGRADTILEAVDVLKGAGITPVLAGGEEADLVAAELAKRGVSVVLSPRTTRREDGKFVSVAAALRAAGVQVALGSFGWGGSHLLPLSACAAARDGLSPEDALAALTTTAAMTAGIADAGKLEAGARADVVAWSGDPMEPASRVLAVMARGKLVEPQREQVSQ
jgi:imidazolonepropionase-like amidohydrolase